MSAQGAFSTLLFILSLLSPSPLLPSLPPSVPSSLFLLSSPSPLSNNVFENDQLGYLSLCASLLTLTLEGNPLCIALADKEVCVCVCACMRVCDVCACVCVCVYMRSCMCNMVSSTLSYPPCRVVKRAIAPQSARPYPI